MNEKKSVFDILMQNDIPKPQTKRIKNKRLSKVWGADVVLILQELPYSRVAELQQEKEMNVHIMLAGVVDPNLRDQSLLDRHDAATPVELVKKLFLPGEVEDVSREIEKLCGYRVPTFETVDDVKKK